MHKCMLAPGLLLTALLPACHGPFGPTAPSSAGPAPPDSHLTLLQTSDLHDHASGLGPRAEGGPGPSGSYARIAAYVNEVRRHAGADRPVVLVDAGDWTMGTVYDFTLTQRPLATWFMDSLGYDCATLGNHEFDYGPKGLAGILAASQASFGFRTPIVASNLALNGAPGLAPYLGTAITPTFTKTLPNGLKVGFLGLMGRTAAEDTPSAAPVTFTDYSLDYTAVQALVNGLRHQQGCHVVIALSHAGTNAATGGYTGEDVQLAEHVTGIDVIASGHSHNAFGADGAASHAVVRGSWTTRLISPGAFGTHVSRLDLTYHGASARTTVDAASNLPMTDATLTALKAGGPDPVAASAVAAGDAALNASLLPLLQELIPNRPSASASLGLETRVGSAAQDLLPNAGNPMPNPNGLGNLCADAVRSSANDLVASSLRAAGWDGAPGSSTLPAARERLTAQGYDPTPFTVAIVPTGTLRGGLSAGAPVSFAGAYEVLSLGISPDPYQTIPQGHPLLSAYLPYPDLQKLCALQLLAQTNLIPAELYLNLSGLSYRLTPAGAQAFFKFTTTASLYRMAAAKAAGRGPQATQALADLEALATDPGGSALLADLGANPFVNALAALNDGPGPGLARVEANLPVLAAVAACARADAAHGTRTLDALLFAKALDAIGPLSGFPATDPACEGTPTPLPLEPRFRVVADLYTILMMTSVQKRLGMALTAYQGSIGGAPLAQGHLARLMGNRINRNGPDHPIRELKAWMALVRYLTKPPAQGGWFSAGAIPSDYGSSPTVRDFPWNGAAVTVRNASYPQASLLRLMGTLDGLASAD